MQVLDQHRLNVFDKGRTSAFGWRWQFTTEVKDGMFVGFDTVPGAGRSPDELNEGITNGWTGPTPEMILYDY